MDIEKSKKVKFLVNNENQSAFIVFSNYQCLRVYVAPCVCLFVCVCVYESV